MKNTAKTGSKCVCVIFLARDQIPSIQNTDIKFYSVIRMKSLFMITFNPEYIYYSSAAMLDLHDKLIIRLVYYNQIRLTNILSIIEQDVKLLKELGSAKAEDYFQFSLHYSLHCSACRFCTDPGNCYKPSHGLYNFARAPSGTSEQMGLLQIFQHHHHHGFLSFLELKLGFDKQATCRRLLFL